MKHNSLKLFSSLTLIASICACVDSNVAGGISEETEGIVAITDKTIAGVSQKGPFAKGSSVYLKETKDDGSLTPTGKEFYATIRNDAGEFKIENINLESQYALLTVEGYYTRESTNMFSSCAISLNAVTDISKRNSTNINLLTHFEYQRILNLVEAGATFASAKAQAEKEIFAAFGYEKHERTAEDLDITGQSEEDSVLYEISEMVDNNFRLDYIATDNPTPCQETKALIDSIAGDFASDGIFSDSLTAAIVDYSYQNKTSNFQRILKKHAGLGECSLAEASNTYKTKRTVFIKGLSHDYAICTGKNWILIPKDSYDDATAIIQHKTGTMTDPRDGRTYKTTSFTINGKKYEWMAENLQYAGDKYTWTEAMAIDDSLVSKPNASSILNGDSVHQGICPENWHIPGSWEWKDLLEYVGSPNKLYSKNWNKINFTGVQLEDNIDFNAEPSFFEPYTDIDAEHSPWEPYINCDGCENPYANFITYTLDHPIDLTITTYPHNFIDYYYSYDPFDDNGYINVIASEMSRGELNIVSVLFGTYTIYSIPENAFHPTFTIIESTKTNFEVNVRCVKN